MTSEPNSDRVREGASAVIRPKQGWQEIYKRRGSASVVLDIAIEISRAEHFEEPLLLLCDSQVDRLYNIQLNNAIGNDKCSKSPLLSLIREVQSAAFVFI